MTSLPRDDLRDSKALTRRRFPALTAHNYADQSHPAVMAAALVAKAERDRRLDELDRACGSLCSHIPRRGYPGDDTTAWLARYHRFFGALPVDVRLTWGHGLARRGRGGRRVQPGRQLPSFTPSLRLAAGCPVALPAPQRAPFGLGPLLCRLPRAPVKPAS